MRFLILIKHFYYFKKQKRITDLWARLREPKNTKCRAKLIRSWLTVYNFHLLIVHQFVNSDVEPTKNHKSHTVKAGKREEKELKKGGQQERIS